MGRDKALLDFGGRPLLERVIERAGSVADELLLIAAARPEYARFGIRLVPDRLPETGSLGGIFTAIVEASHSHCLVLACDMPFVNAHLLEFMAEMPRDYDVLVPSLPARRSRQGGDETLETLHAIYTKACRPAIERQLGEGIFKVVSFFGKVRVRRIPEIEVRRIDPELLSFFNANTPSELAWAERHARMTDNTRQSKGEV